MVVRGQESRYTSSKQMLQYRMLSLKVLSFMIALYRSSSIITLSKISAILSPPARKGSWIEASSLELPSEEVLEVAPDIFLAGSEGLNGASGAFCSAAGRGPSGDLIGPTSLDLPEEDRVGWSCGGNGDGYERTRTS